MPSLPLQEDLGTSSSAFCCNLENIVVFKVAGLGYRVCLFVVMWGGRGGEGVGFTISGAAVSGEYSVLGVYKECSKNSTYPYGSTV